MKEFIVSLNFLTDAADKELSFFKLLEEKGFEVSCRKANNGLLWRVESEIDDCEPLSDHIESITSSVSSEQLLDHCDIFSKIYIDIGVCYSTYTCSVSLPKNSLKLIHDLSPEIGIEIVCYPSDDE